MEHSVPIDTADRVMMRLAEKVIWQSDTREHLAAALSSHGLRELVLAARNVIDESADEPLSLRLEMAVRRLDASFTTLLGEGETLKIEEQADGTNTPS